MHRIAAVSRSFLALVVVLAVAAALRLPSLDRRPPHHDEGVNGSLAAEVARTGVYRYDPANFHGPLYFYALAASRPADLTELRLPTALVGIAMCGLPFLLGIGARRALAIGLLLATSPLLVYFARFAIHETLLVALTLAFACCVLRRIDGGGRGWAVASIVLVAAVVATKETAALLVVAALAVAAIDRRAFVRWWPGSAAVALGLAFAVGFHVVVFTAAFRDLRGLKASVDAYLAWAGRGAEHGHAKPWWYHLALLGRYELVLAIAAVAGVLQRDVIARVGGLLALALLAAYSLVPYKTPWLVTSAVALLAIPAGHLLGDPRARLHGAAVLALVTGAAAAQAVRLSFVRPADPRELAVYVQTSDDYAAYMRTIDRAGPGATIAVDVRDPWPLPWVLRGRRVRWSAAGPPSDVMIVEERRKIPPPRGYVVARYRLLQPILVYARVTP
jgi:uncharacterized protein (TIGR03663 family)